MAQQHDTKSETEFSPKLASSEPFFFGSSSSFTFPSLNPMQKPHIFAKPQDIPSRHYKSAPAISSTRTNPFIGVTLDDIQKLQIIGTGTFSKVYLVKCKGEHYAMKVVPKKKLQNAKQINGIVSEKDILLAIDHPYIINMYTTFQDAEYVYMLMEFAAGGELFYRLRDGGKFDENMTKFIAAEIVMALEHLHSMNIIYRDLKLENVVLSANGHVRLTDFGFARKFASSTAKTFTICGTAEYLAPELILGQGYSFVVDWWSLGVLIFEMMSGYSPFYEDDPMNIYRKIVGGRIEFPSFITGEAKSFIKRLLTRNPSKRLGANGASEIRNHPWFENFNWQSPTPLFVPPLVKKGDAFLYQVDIDENEFTSAPQDEKSHSTADGANPVILSPTCTWLEGF